MFLASLGSRAAASTSSRAFAGILFLVAAASSAKAQWTAISLHPAGATNSIASGIRNGQQVGRVDGNAAIWTGTAASVMYLDLSGATGLSATDGVEQVGGFGNHAAVWSGTPGSFVDLDPAVPGSFGSAAVGVFAGIQVGYIIGPPTFFDSHAALWTDSAASYVDLSPPGSSDSAAAGEYNGQEIGSAIFGSVIRVGVWYGTANSFVDIDPPGAMDARGSGIYLGKQVGYVTLADNIQRASLWSSTAASWVDLHPPTATASDAHGISSSPANVFQEVGQATIGGNYHASFWNGSSASWVDLHSFLPPGYVHSSATGVWTNNQNTLTFVVGFAVTPGGNDVAMMWVRHEPTPITFYCPGDGTGTGCPCGNNAPLYAGTGCLNSLGMGGRVVATGVPSISADTLALFGSQMPNSSALYFQGTTQLNGGLGVLFGDGLRCASGTVIRLGTKLNAGGASQYPIVGDLSISVKGAIASPGTRTYQVWYRNPAAFCAPETYNFTNALSVAWSL